MGYVYNDCGWEVLDEVYVDVFGVEVVLVCFYFVLGIYMIVIVFFGVLCLGDELLYIIGKFYDILYKVIGSLEDGIGFFWDFGIGYCEIVLLVNGSVDWDVVKGNIIFLIKVIGI